MTDNATHFVLDNILPSWVVRIRRLESTNTHDKKAIKEMNFAIREIRDYIVEINDTMSRNSINYLREAIIPLENMKLLKGLEYYEGLDSFEYKERCGYLDELSKLANDIHKVKKQYGTIGWDRHYSIMGEEISAVPNDEVRRSAVINGHHITYSDMEDIASGYDRKDKKKSKKSHTKDKSIPRKSKKTGLKIKEED